jgi:uncharacterized protein (TIGR00369 family)
MAGTLQRRELNAMYGARIVLRTRDGPSSFIRTGKRAMNDAVSAAEGPSNPDHALILRFLKGEKGPTAFDANPLARALGARLVAADATSGRLEMEYEPGLEFVQGAGMIQGGAIASMLDFVMAFAVMTRLGADRTVTTTSLNVLFLKAAPNGRYVCAGEIERAGRTIAFARATLFPRGGSPVASASSTLAIVDPS